MTDKGIEGGEGESYYEEFYPACFVDDSDLEFESNCVAYSLFYKASWYSADGSQIHITKCNIKIYELNKYINDYFAAVED